MSSLLLAHHDHSREWGDFFYVYPVISRRARGVSIGVNLNPDKVCNFDCVYCEVDRQAKPRIRHVDVGILDKELRAMLEIWKTDALFQKEPFASAPKEWRRLNDIAFSGDGEPTTCPVFKEAVETVFNIRGELAPKETKIILITNATCLDRPAVQEGLRVLQKGAHEVWAKLDAGTEDYYKLVNRSSVPFARVLRNITETARWLPLTVQSLFLRMHGQPPSEEEVMAYCDRLEEIIQAGGQIQKLQLYTVARPTREAWATALSREELEHVAEIIKRRSSLLQELSYGD
ncbi:MAG: radical SAM protein [bacterium]